MPRDRSQSLYEASMNFRSDAGRADSGRPEQSGHEKQEKSEFADDYKMFGFSPDSNIKSVSADQVIDAYTRLYPVYQGSPEKLQKFKAAKERLSKLYSDRGTGQQREAASRQKPDNQQAVKKPGAQPKEVDASNKKEFLAAMLKNEISAAFGNNNIQIDSDTSDYVLNKATDLQQAKYFVEMKASMYGADPKARAYRALSKRMNDQAHEVFEEYYKLKPSKQKK